MLDLQTTVSLLYFQDYSLDCLSPKKADHSPHTPVIVAEHEPRLESIGEGIHLLLTVHELEKRKDTLT